MSWYYNNTNNFWYNNLYEIKPIENAVVIYKNGIYYKKATSFKTAKTLLENE